MYFIETNFPIPPIALEETFPLTSSLSTDHLPKSYLSLLTERNGGYIKNTKIPTEEPSSDGLDYANLHYIFGIHNLARYSILFQQTIPERQSLPDYLVIFSANEQQLFAFDYSQLSQEKEPSIRYLDLETGNWQTVAKDFQTFMDYLKPGEIKIPLEGKLTLFEAEHSFLLITDPAMLTGLWMHLEDSEFKEWYFYWLAYFANHSDVGMRQSTIDALETQILYYRLSLPKNTQDVFEIFLNDTESSIRHQAEWLLKEWKE